MTIHYLFNILILYMVNNISISITDNSNKGKKGKKGKKKETKETTQTKKPRKTRKDKGVPRKKKTTPVNVAPTQTGTYAYNTASNPPIHLEPPFIEQNKIEISNLKNKINEITPQNEIMNTKLNETSQQVNEFTNKISGIVKKEVVNNLNTIYKPPSVKRQERRTNLKERKMESSEESEFKKFWSSSSDDDKQPFKKAYKDWQNQGYRQWREIAKKSKKKSPSTDAPFPPPPELKRSSSAVKQAVENIENKIRPPPLSSTMTASINRLTTPEPIDNPPSLVDVEQFKNDILGNETEEQPRQRRKPRFEFKRVYTHRYESS